jgi:ketosteroid isomerase-like protein
MPVQPSRFLLAACSLASAVFLPASAKPNPVSAENEVRELERRANAAYEANDLPQYFSFYAWDFAQFLPEGRSDVEAYKREWTAYIGAGNRVEKVAISDLHIQIGPSQDTAVASYVLHVRTRRKDGKISEEENQESDVLFKRSGARKIVFLHYSAAPKK